MPTMSWRTWVGLAPDRVNASLNNAGIFASNATALPLYQTVGTTGTLSTAGSTYSAIILDGPNTETVSVLSNLSGGSVSVSATANAHVGPCYIYFQPTASVGPTAYLPVETAQLVDIYDQIPDNSNRGSAVSTVGVVQGMRTSTFDIGGAVFADTVGYLLGGLFGAEDYAAGPPKTHKFAVLNGVSTLTPPGQAYEPVPYIFYQYNGYNQRAISGRVSEVDITLDPKALMKYTAKVIARASGVVSTTATPTFSAVTPTAAWNGYLTLSGTNDFRCQSFEVTMTRENSEMIPVLQGNQDPATAELGPLKVTWKSTLYKDDDVALNEYINESQPTVTLTCTQGSGSTSTGLNFQMSKCNFGTGEDKVTGKSYVVEDFTGEGIANSTDANTAGGGLSPVQLLLTNAIGTGVYT